MSSGCRPTRKANLDFYTFLIEIYFNIITFMVTININGCATT